MTNVDDFLEHFGVKGMKWGIRTAPKSAKKTSADYRKTTEMRKRRSSELTNNQIKKANERMNLEVNFNRLNPGKVKRGDEHAKYILAIAGTGVAAYSMYNSPAGKAAIRQAKKFLGKQQNGQMSLW